MIDLKYPLRFEFKLLSLTNEIRVFDSSGQVVMFVHQEMVKVNFKEKIKVYSSEVMDNQLYSIGSEGVMDPPASYNFFDAADQKIGTINRKVVKSLVTPSYEVLDASGALVCEISEDGSWKRGLGAVAKAIPVVGSFTGYFLKPKYSVADSAKSKLATIDRENTPGKPSFVLSENTQMSPEARQLVALASIMFAVMEEDKD